MKTNDRRSYAIGHGKNQRSASKVSHVARHHTGVQVDQSMDILEGYWFNTHGWDIGGYHEVIHEDGSVDLNYDPTTMTYGVGDHNSYTMHISLTGNGRFTEAQERSWEERALFHMKNLAIPIECVKGHNEFPGHEWNACPGVNMDAVRNRLKSLLAANPKPVISQVAGAVIKKYAESAVFVPNDEILVRDQPSTKGKHVATYKAGEAVAYHTVQIVNGYVWLQYNRYNGKQGYLPCRTFMNGVYGELWGRIDDVVPVPTMKTYVHLSAKVSSWRFYSLGVAPVAGKEKGFLNPAKFGGLVYEVEGYEDSGTTAIIRTGDFGKGKIYVDSDAKIFKQ